MCLARRRPELNLLLLLRIQRMLLRMSWLRTLVPWRSIGEVAPAPAPVRGCSFREVVLSSFAEQLQLQLICSFGDSLWLVEFLTLYGLWLVEFLMYIRIIMLRVWMVVPCVNVTCMDG